MIKLTNMGTVNKNRIDIGNLTLWFSYETVVAFAHPDTNFVCSENVWSNTTGKLLNEICPNHKERTEKELFNQKLEKLLKDLNLN